jgi:hypothetical protein
MGFLALVFAIVRKRSLLLRSRIWTAFLHVASRFSPSIAWPPKRRPHGLAGRMNLAAASRGKLSIRPPILQRRGAMLPLFFKTSFARSTIPSLSNSRNALDIVLRFLIPVNFWRVAIRGQQYPFVSAWDSNATKTAHAFPLVLMAIVLAGLNPLEGVEIVRPGRPLRIFGERFSWLERKSRDLRFLFCNLEVDRLGFTWLCPA